MYNHTPQLVFPQPKMTPITEAEAARYSKIDEVLKKLMGDAPVCMWARQELIDLYENNPLLDEKDEKISELQEEIEELKTLGGRVRNAVRLLNKAYENFTLADGDTSYYEDEMHLAEAVEEGKEEGLKQLLDACDLLDQDGEVS